jgi:hypothetical protein
MDCFRELGLEWGADEAEVRRAYAALIKQYRPESHPAEFARIREAYETARRLSRLPREDSAALVEAETYDLEQDELASEAPPRPECVRTLRIVEDGPPSQNPDAVLDDMIHALDAQVAKGDEAQSLRAFDEQWQLVSALPLDMQMDYAYGLREWVIYSGRAPLRLILVAAERFGWHTQQRDVERNYGREGMHRLELLLELADHYAEAGDSRSPYLRIDGVRGESSPLIASHHATDWAKALEGQWQAVCDQAGMAELGERLRFVLPRRVQVFWVDVFLALFVAAATWLDIGPAPDWQGWAALAALVPAALFAPALVRAAGVALGADSPRQAGVNLLRRYRDWWARKVEKEDGDGDAMLTRAITLTLLLAVLFIYGVIAVAQDGSAVLWLGVLVISIASLTAAFMIYSKLAEMESWLAGTLLALVRLPQQIRTERGGTELQDQRPSRRRKPEPRRIPRVLWAGNVRWWWLALIVVTQLARILAQH